MTPYLDWMISHCVPFPEAGAPAMMILGGDFLVVVVDSDVAAAAATVEEEDVKYPRALAQLVRDDTFCLFLLACNVRSEAAA